MCKKDNDNNFNKDKDIDNEYYQGMRKKKVIRNSVYVRKTMIITVIKIRILMMSIKIIDI